jgi:hypothetical protein
LCRCPFLAFAKIITAFKQNVIPFCMSSGLKGARAINIAKKKRGFAGDVSTLALTGP